MTTGFQYIKNVVRLFAADSCTEAWLARFSVSDLMRLYDVDKQSDFDIPPWRWTYNQIRDAIMTGDIPNWDANLKPIPSVKRLEEE